MGTPYDPAKHPDPPWQWTDDPRYGPNGGYWKLRGSDGGAADPTGQHGYNCVQYTLAKIQGRRPHPSDGDDFSTLPQRLALLGYQQINCAQCGCDQGQCKDCVVIYSTPTGGPFHAAVFDPVLCDWGGKLSGVGPVVRFQNVTDYAKPGEIMTCYCRNQPGTYISDEDVNQGYVIEEGPSGWDRFKLGLRNLFVRLSAAAIILLIRALLARLRRALQRLLDRLRRWPFTPR
jgi:hypothetical protein